MSKVARPLADATRLADAVIADLSPFCCRIATAGSVRRRKAEVGDLEVCAIPRWELSGGLFQDQSVNTLWTHLHDGRRYEFVKGDTPEGRYFQLLLAEGMQVDLFLAQASNWGWIYLLRTGSAEFSHGILSRWKRRQGIGPEGRGSVNGHLVTREGAVVVTPEESDVFRAVRLSFVAPEERSGRVWSG